MYVYLSNGTRNTTPVNKYMKEVHDHMYIKYKMLSQKGDRDNAQKLENFFQDLKNYAHYIKGKPDYISNSLFEMLLDEIDRIEKRRNSESRYQVSSLFRRSLANNDEQGKRFE